MKQRPLSITFIASLFLVVGWMASLANLSSIVFAAPNNLTPVEPTETVERLVQLGINCSAVVGGVFLLRGANWARWLLIAWMVFHFGLSFFHSTFEVVFHTTLFIPIAILLFRKPASRFFSGSRIAANISDNNSQPLDRA
jgi:hypothetical protein